MSLIYNNHFVTIPCLHTAVGGSAVTLNDGAAGTPTIGVGEQMEVLSTSASDDVGSTGATGWGIVYLDSNGDVQTETGDTDGTAAVLTVATDISALLDFFCTSYGSGGNNVGDLTIRSNATTTSRATIKASRRRAGLGCFTIPANHEGYFVGAGFVNANTAAAAPTKALINVQADIDPGTGALNTGNFVNLTSITTGISKPMRPTPKDRDAGITLPALSTIRARGQVNATGCEISGNIYILLRRIVDPYYF